MTGWDVLDRLVNTFPPIVMMLLLVAVLAAIIVFIVGFGRHGFSFLKYGFKQVSLDSSIEKRFDKLESKIGTIETNHFRHLKNYLGILNGALLDKEIINNETKARMDAELSGM